MNILETIVRHKREEVSRRKRAGLDAHDMDPGPPRGFRRALVSDPGVSVIAEVKRASPSKGLLCPDFDPVALARDYEEGGASAISVLTDEKFFQGNISFLTEIRRNAALPLLRKDFIIDHFQVEEARAYGADAILLIVAILDPALMSELLSHAGELGLDVLTEVHDERELEAALKAEADLIGVNNRNLRDFSISLDTTFRLREILPREIPMVSESGISTTEHMRALREQGIHAALIGESLVKKTDDRISHLSALVEAGRG